MPLENTVESLIKIIQQQFSGAYPNGILSGWDSSRFYPDITRLLPGKKVINQTDFNYSFCNSFSVELEGQFVLQIKVSFICDAFSLGIYHYKNNREMMVPLVDSLESQPQLDIVRKFFIGKNFREIQSHQMDIKIPGINLELAKEVTLGKCLFDDFE